MSGKRARLSSIAKQLDTVSTVSPKASGAPSGPSIDPNPERGQRGEFLRVTVTLPAELLGAIRELGLRRRARGQRDTTVSALLREAAAELLERERGK